MLDGVRRLRSSGGRVQVNAALEIAEELLARLRQIAGVRRAAYAGSLRRMAETIGDVDLLVASDDRSRVMEAFVGLRPGRPRDREGRDEVVDRDARRAPGRSAGRRPTRRGAPR